MRRRPPLFALTALVALAVTGCAERAKASPMEVLVASAEETREAGTSRLAVLVEAEQPALKLGGDGVFDYASRRGRIAMDLSSLGVPGGGTSTVLVAGTVFYIELPPAAASQLGGKSWIKVDLAELGKMQGIDLGQLNSLQGNDPAAALDFLRGASEDTRKVGEEKVRGADTTHYAATLDLDKAAQSLDAEVRDDFERATAQLGTRQMPVDVWIDGDGRLRKMTYALDTSKLQGAPAGGAAGTVKTTVELFDFGVEVDVQEPPVDQVTDLSQLLSGLPGGAR